MIGALGVGHASKGGMSNTQFARMSEPNIYGYETESAHGFTIEVVRCYENDWNVFLTVGGHVVARSVDEYRKCGNGYVSRFEAFAIARALAS